MKILIIGASLAALSLFFKVVVLGCQNAGRNLVGTSIIIIKMPNNYTNRQNHRDLGIPIQ